MSDRRCDREGDIIEALAAGRSIDADGELRKHVQQCAACADLALVAGDLLEDRRSLMRDAAIPGAGLVWWRAMMRARQDEARAAMRRARLVQVGLVLVSLIVAVTLIGGRIAAHDFQAVLAAAPSGFSGLGVPLLAFAAWLILAPVAVYFVVSEE